MITIIWVVVGGMQGNFSLNGLLVSFLGGYAGNKVQEGMQDRNTYQETQRVCKTVRDSHQENVGYDVTYRLNGRDQVARMDYDPGSRIPIENGALVLRK